MTVGRQLYYWLNHTQCQAGSCSQIESERSDQGSSSGHLHDRHPGNPGADSALEHTCAGLHSEKGSFCLTTRLSFTVFLALPLAISVAKTTAGTGVGVPTPIAITDHCKCLRWRKTCNVPCAPCSTTGILQILPLLSKFLGYFRRRGSCIQAQRLRGIRSRCW